MRGELSEADSSLWDTYRKKLIKHEPIEGLTELSIDQNGQDKVPGQTVLSAGEKGAFFAMPGSMPGEYLLIPNPYLTFGREAIEGLFPPSSKDPERPAVYQPRIAKSENGHFIVEDTH